MRASEYDRLKKILDDRTIKKPIKSYEMIGRKTDIEFSQLRQQLCMDELQKRPNEINVDDHPYYFEFIKCIPAMHRQHLMNYTAVINQNRKISTLCCRELKRGLSRTGKTNPSLKSKRIGRELLKHVNKMTREVKEKIRKEDAENEQKKKEEQQQKEEMRQRRKFNYLMSQTEAFASFFLNRRSCNDNLEDKIDDKLDNNLDDNLDDKCGLKATEQQLQYLREFETQKNNDKSDSQAYIYTEVNQPTILKTTLKKYQLKGLNWLVNLYNQGINGILADDMGLGKTVQTISLLGYLAEVEDIWGPFLIITPASTLHNWENEFYKFIPDFKTVVYYGSIQERTELRKQFKKATVIITSYQVAVTDEAVFKKIKWQYMVLDEAQAIKSINSQRWKTLLGFKARNRCLLTGTPIQNNMQELWALLNFIMPTLFDSLSEFSEWFMSDNGIDETQVDKLHTILKPFMLRRHKDDIKDEIGAKEIINISCNLSSRQKLLYSEILNSGKKDYENTVMQLKKVCNHPDLFEKLEPESALMFGIEGDGTRVEYRGYFREYISPEVKIKTETEISEMFRMHGERHIKMIEAKYNRINNNLNNNLEYKLDNNLGNNLGNKLDNSLSNKLDNNLGNNLDNNLDNNLNDNVIFDDLIRKKRAIINDLNRFSFITEKATNCPLTTNLHNNSIINCNRLVHVPPINTFIADSGKLLEVDSLLTKLYNEGHRPLIYFQMTKMMDLFEEYLIKKEYSYLRLDGSSKVGTRKELVKEWQTKDIFIFLLSTRAGGVGLNLTAGDTVIFYDSDWNPTVDQQAMDRVHRLGQTKNVTVYRLVTKDSIEEKVMERANKKDEMQKIVIKGNVFEGS